jgi:hypothetical protein
MKLNAPINENYAAVVVVIKSLTKLDNCDNVVHANIFGNRIVVGNDTKVGEKGLYFPVETRLSDEFLHENNLYRDKTKNKDTNEKGYFEDNGRIRCVKFRGHKSEGFFIPVGSLLFCAEVDDLASVPEGKTFDAVNGITICEKYVPKFSRTHGTPKEGKGQKYKKVPRVIDGQFRLHAETSQLGKNIFKIIPHTVISITNKIHGTSFVVGKVLCKKKLSLKAKIAKFFGVQVVDTHYDIIYSSRKVVKNDDLNKEHFYYYGEDLWKDISEELAPFLVNGMTIYGEAAGFTKGGKAIQKGYDYGFPKEVPGYYGECGAPKPFGLFVYRITMTNVNGVVFEFSARQVQDWCRERGIDAVPEFFYGKALELVPYEEDAIVGEVENPHIVDREEWQHKLLDKLQHSFNLEELCYLCTNNKVPAEGIVVRLEVPEFDAYKLKSFRFKEWETKQLDAGEVDMETQESQTE